MARLFALFCYCLIVGRAVGDDKAWEAIQIVIGISATFFVITCAVLATSAYYWKKSRAETQATIFALRMEASANTTNRAYDGPNAADEALYDEFATILTAHGKGRYRTSHGVPSVPLFYAVVDYRQRVRRQYTGYHACSLVLVFMLQLIDVHV